MTSPVGKICPLWMSISATALEIRCCTLYLSEAIFNRRPIARCRCRSQHFRGARLHAAARSRFQGHLEVVRLLLSHRASRTMKNEWGQTAVDLARLHEDNEILALLED